MDSGGSRSEGPREAGRNEPTGGPTDAEGRRIDDDEVRVHARRAGPDEPPAGESRRGRLTEDDLHRAARDAAREGAREAIEEREQQEEEDSGGGGLYGSRIDAQHLVGAALAEVVGTFILIFGGTAVAVGAILSRPTAGAPYDSLAVALAFGLALAVVVAALGHVSGAHVNPAVTVGLAVIGKFPWGYAAVYVAAQLAGAVLAALATWLTYGGAARSVASLAATYPASGAADQIGGAQPVGDLQAFVVEALITFILVFVVVSVATDRRAPAAIAPIAVGFALAVGVFIAGPVTGGAVNPARALGPMIVAGDFTSAWVYVAGPIVGGVLAAVLYERTMAQTEAPE